MEIHVLASGSKANTTLIKCDNFNIIIDCGLAITKLKKELAVFDLTINDIDIVLMTHFHSDHCASLKYFNPKIIYSVEENYNNLKHDEVFEINNVRILPFLLSHDNNCTGYQIIFNKQVFTYITDTGYVRNELYPLIKESHYLLIEFNHDHSLLQETHRPNYVKQRILSDKGHLNNTDAAVVVCNCDDNLQQLIIAHISQEANTITTITKALDKVYLDYEKDINYDIIITNQIQCESAGTAYEGKNYLFR